MATEKRLIDANAMRQDWLENGENEFVYDTNSVLESIDAQPTVDAVEVVHGRWIPTAYSDPEGGKYYLFHCSKCCAPNARQRNYCPDCGAKMDGDGNEC